MFSFTVNTAPFQEWVSEVRVRFELMVQTMIDVAHLVESNTMWRVPLETGRLEQSFNFVVVENNSNFIEVEIGYDAVDPYDGYHYAEYQHTGVNWKTGEPLHYKIRGEQYFLLRGMESSIEDIKQLIETDYLSLFKGV